MKRKGWMYLFLIFLFTVQLNAKDVYLGGESIGIKLKYEGLLISATYDIDAYNPTQNDIQAGDTLIEINNKRIETIHDLNAILQNYPNQTVKCTLLRDNQTIYRNLRVILDGNKIKTGLFVKDEITGIGTLTYIDPTNYTFASLGHEVVDQDTKQIIRLSEGLLYTSSVVDIHKAQTTRVGEKQALIDFDEQLGIVYKVNRFGVYGKSNQLLSTKLIETAKQEEIEQGPAVMYTVLDNENIEAIDIEIIHTYKQKEANIKSFEFKITDHEALHKTNGIVQGMSGSPIVQKNKLIGAVTHVSSSNPTNGYGIYIEWMLKESE